MLHKHTESAKKRAYMQKKLCKTFCHYYKPAKDRDLACMGLLVVERLIRRGTDISFHAIDRVLTAETQEMLVRNMCTVCPFYEGDCDFVQKDREKGTPPCGGFLLLGHLLETHMITIDNIKEVS